MKKGEKNDEEKEGEEKKKYKIKMHKATAKRFRMTGSGKIMCTKGRQGHFHRRKSKRIKRQFVEMQEVRGSGYKWWIRKLAPYLKR